MNVTVEFFGMLRERAKTRQRTVHLAGPATVDELFTNLCGDYAGFHALRGCISVAVNDELATSDRSLSDGDTVALLPPVAGGSGPYARLTHDPLSIDEVTAAVRAPQHGGLVTFTGWVREDGDLYALEYEAHEAMARRSLLDVTLRVEQRFDDVNVAVAHRIGTLKLGELIVVIAAASRTRSDAFDAARLCLELLKQETPIWKKELRPSGDRWVNDPTQGVAPQATGRDGSAVH
jgi:molybdopterin synthase catalytic subunit